MGVGPICLRTDVSTCRCAQEPFMIRVRLGLGLVRVRVGLQLGFGIGLVS